MNTPSRKILVTGVAGFLGSHLAEKLSEFNPDFERTELLADGVYLQIPFCKGGSYAYTITTDSQYAGFDVDVLPPEQDVQEFVDESG